MTDSTKKTQRIALLALLAWSMAYGIMASVASDVRWAGLGTALTAGTGLALALLALAWRNRLWRGLLTAAYAGYLVMVMINVAFIKIFSSYASWDFLLDFLGTTDAASFGLGYAHLVPSWFMAATGISLGAFALAAWGPGLLRRMPARGQNLLPDAPRSARPWYGAAGVLIIVLQGLGLSALLAHPPSHWRDIQAFAADIGPLGSLYSWSASPARAGQGVERPVAEILDQIAEPRPNEPAEAGPIDRIIIYQLESMPAWPAMMEPTLLPRYRQARTTGLHAETFMANSCQTINAELAALCSVIGPSQGPVNMDHLERDFECLPHLLARSGWQSWLYHANDADFYDRDELAPAWGFDRTVFADELGHKRPDDMTVDRLLGDLERASGPTMAYLVGYTGHGPYDDEQRAYYRDAYGVDLTPYEGPIDPWIRDNIEAPDEKLGIYLSFLRHADHSLGYLLDELERRGLSGRTAVVVFGDHRYFQLLSSNAAANFFAHNQLPFVLIAPGLEPRTVDIASHIDVAPTLLDLLDKDIPDHFMGTSLVGRHRSAIPASCIGQTSLVTPHATLVGSVRSASCSELLPGNNVSTEAPLCQALGDLIHASDSRFQENALTKSLH